MHYIVLLICLWCVQAHAQIVHFPLPLDGTFQTATDKNKSGVFKAQKVKGKITGTGAYRFKNGTVYVGDFNDKHFHGLGMLIPSSTDSISNCPSATVYVGRFKNGLKNGKGTCYNSKGEVIYAGRFKDDAPVDSFPQPRGDNRYFTDFKSETSYFVGEFDGELPNGFGAMFFNNGDFCVSKFKEGMRDGISVYIQEDGNWFSENVEGDTSIPISSSEEYASLETRAKAAFRASMSEALGYFTQAVESGVQIAQIAGSSNNTSLSGTFVEVPAASSQSGGGVSDVSGTTGGQKYDMSEQRAYNRDKSTYAKYDSMLSAAFAGNRSATSSEIKEWQSKMRSLRTKWEAKGRSFPHFANEDK